jgi:pimeloyl-ACP methyl ester carboxylesterase
MIHFASFKSVMVAGLGLGLLAACSGGPAQIDPAIACHVGAYRTAGGEVVDFGPLSSPALRWRLIDGRTGRIERGEDGIWSGVSGWSDNPHPARFDLGDCGETVISISGLEGVEGEAERIAFGVEDTSFAGADESLAGRLVLPEGEGPFPLVVLVHGSEASSARDFAYLQRLLPAQGVAAFVYDKRGTGQSTGEYSQDFDLLAADAVAAMEEALRLGGERISIAGYQGGSQGGWIAPYATTLSDPDFVIASFGMAEGPLAEDREEVRLDLIAAGYGDDAEALAGGRALAEAAGRVMASDFENGVDELAALKQRYEAEPWYQHVEGEFTGEFLVRPIWQTRMGMPFFDVGTSWTYDPLPVLNAIDAPSLWVIAEDDVEAPPDTTRAILAELQANGALLDVAVFPGADHGMIDYVLDEEGERVSTRYSEGYFRLLADWVMTQRLEDEDEYGRAELTPRLFGPEDL